MGLSRSADPNLVCDKLIIIVPHDRNCESFASIIGIVVYTRHELISQLSCRLYRYMNEYEKINTFILKNLSLNESGNRKIDKCNNLMLKCYKLCKELQCSANNGIIH